MALDQVKLGKSVPNEINVIIEIPRDGDAVKYEVDKSSGVLYQGVGRPGCSQAGNRAIRRTLRQRRG